MAQKVRIQSVSGNYAITADGQRLRIIGDAKVGEYAYTDGVVVYGYEHPEFVETTKPAGISKIPLFVSSGVFSQVLVYYTSEKLRRLTNGNLGIAVSAYHYLGGPIVYNTEHKVFMLKEVTEHFEGGSVYNPYISNNDLFYKDENGNEYHFTGIIVRWVGNVPDIQFGEYLRNDYYNNIRTWSFYIDPQTGDPVYVEYNSSANGWNSTICGDVPMQGGNSNNLRINNILVPINNIINAVKSNLQQKHGTAPVIPNIQRPNAQIGKFIFYLEDDFTNYDSSLFEKERFNFDGKKCVINMRIAGLCYPVDNNHPMDDGQGGWWPKELIYKVRAVYELANDTLTVIYMSCVDENGNVEIIHADDGYEFEYNYRYGSFVYDSLTQNLKDSQDNIIYNGLKKPIAVSKKKNLLFNDKIVPPLNSSYSQLNVENGNKSFLKLDDYLKIARAERR